MHFRLKAALIGSVIGVGGALWDSSMRGRILILGAAGAFAAVLGGAVYLLTTWREFRIFANLRGQSNNNSLPHATIVAGVHNRGEQSLDGERLAQLRFHRARLRFVAACAFATAVFFGLRAYGQSTRTTPDDAVKAATSR